MPKYLALSQDPPVLENVTIAVTEVTGETATIRYGTVAGNHPKLNNNTVTIWEGPVIDWKHPEFGVTQLVNNNDTSGTYTMDHLSLQRKDYIVGYSVTGDVLGICASAIAKASDMLMLLAPTSVTLEIASMEPGHLEITYATLRGYKPLANGNWLGLWGGDIDPYDRDKPLEMRTPSDDANAGSVVFTSSLRSHFSYTVCYFMSNKQPVESNTAVAAVLRFDTA